MWTRHSGHASWRRALGRKLEHESREHLRASSGLRSDWARRQPQLVADENREGRPVHRIGGRDGNAQATEGHGLRFLTTASLRVRFGSNLAVPMTELNVRFAVQSSEADRRLAANSGHRPPNAKYLSWNQKREQLECWPTPAFTPKADAILIQPWPFSQARGRARSNARQASLSCIRTRGRIPGSTAAIS